MKETSEQAEMMISGIVCDNKNCDYEDQTVQFSEYPQWLNRPCPKCGENLLTQKDYDQSLRMLRAVEIVNKIGKVLRWINPMFYYRLITGKKAKTYSTMIDLHAEKHAKQRAQNSI